MEKLGLNEIRRLFKDFYTKKGHYEIESFPLVPSQNEKSLLLINSGMAPLKPYFSGEAIPPSLRMTDCQKCIRTADLENVGKTARHGSFFEMLGSFSFGEYFKEDSLRWGLEFLLDVLKLPIEKLWVSVYEEDDEAYDIWLNKLNFPKSRIIKLGKKDNFWEIGLGPCGPCSEFFYDRGEEFGCGKDDCKPGCDCDRFPEFWNHVFTQFEKLEDGSYIPLAKKNIDTGMGLERIATIVQNVNSIFDVDTIRTIVDEIAKKANIVYETGNDSADISIRIITDHIRSAVFLISDGVIPGNEGRAYILRKLLRRAIMHSKRIGIRTNFLYILAEKVIESSSEEYENLRTNRQSIIKEIKNEEERFEKTVYQGEEILEKEIVNLSGNILSGKIAFKLYDTYGFPLDITKEILEEKNIIIDEEEFNSELKKQKERSRGDRENKIKSGWLTEDINLTNIPKTEFYGYDYDLTKSKVLAIFDQNGNRILSSGSHKNIKIILDKTSIYPMKGGQESDTGSIFDSIKKIAIIDSAVEQREIVIHDVKILDDYSFQIRENMNLSIFVDKIKRNQSSANHTATHLLHAALKNILGENINQKGSFVNDKFLRFDFNFDRKLSDDEILKIENYINERIAYNYTVETKLMKIDDAKVLGATALFDEKYANEVRVIKISDFSIELCGGTHVKSSGLVGGFCILSESSISSGIRRIEAITSIANAHLLRQKTENEKNIATILKTSPDAIVKRIEKLKEELSRYKKIGRTKNNILNNNLIKKIIEKNENINNINFIYHIFDESSVNELKPLTDDLRKGEKIFILLETAKKEKTIFIISLSDDLISDDFNAGKIAKKLTLSNLGSGGGQKHLAQFRLRDISCKKQMIDTIKTAIIKGRIE
ncbi:MAG: alanine--tRNA ligase [Clostridiales Family XIII bacterium]|jgi:alanyl-tRNA synthetase|nr:alanine--tRNA ligase [Clostridiales Family XIII bacterium]